MSQTPSTQALGCPLCGETDFAELKRFPEGVVVGKCSHCAFIYTPRRHSHPEGLLGSYRPEMLRVLFAPIVEGRLRHFRDAAFRRYLDLIRRHAPGTRLLDVGCAHGLFPALAARAGFEVCAIEPNPVLAAFAAEQLGVEVIEGKVGAVDLPAAQFDAITFTDSLEYLPDPKHDLGRLTKLLAPGGILLAKVPNACYSELAQRLVDRGFPMGIEPFSPAERACHYTSETLRRLARAVGLESVSIAAFPPIDSTNWQKIVGLPLEIESPAYLDVRRKLIRRLAHLGGQVESGLIGTNHGAQALIMVAGSSSSHRVQ